jgi:hypothetical protein
MARKTPKHEHSFQVIAHMLDWERVLVMCAKLCYETDVWQKGKVIVSTKEVNGRKRNTYRPETDEEFKARWSAIPHICCT